MKLIKKNRRWLVNDQNFFSLFMTFSLIELANIGSGIIDGLIVSRFFDSNALAAVGLANPMFSICGIVSGLLATGMQILCSQQLGKGNLKDMNRIFSSVFYIATVISILFLGLVYIFAGNLAVLFGASGNGAVLAEQATLYIKGLAIGFPPLILCVVLSSGCQLDSARKRVIRSTFVIAGANIILDILVVVLHGGVIGIGLATSISSYIGMGYLLLHFTKKDRMLRLTRFDMDLKEIMNILALGSEKALRRLSNVIAPILMNKIIINYGGSDAMTAMTVQKQLIDFASFLGVGLSDTTSLLVGVSFGEKDEEAIKEVGHCVHRYCILVLGTILVILIVLSKTITSLYIPERGNIYDLSLWGVWMTAFYAPVYALVKSRITFLQAIQKVRKMQGLILLNSLIYLVGSAYFLGKLFGARGVLATRPVCMILTLITVWIYQVVSTKRIAQSANDYIELPEEFSIRPGDAISLDIRNMEDISIVANQIHLLCNGHKIDKKLSLKVAICFEELATNIIKFGFPVCKKAPGIDFRMVCSENEIVFRLKDNCPMFDVESKIGKGINEIEQNGEMKLGLKLISDLSENITYVHSLETNNVIMRFPLENK